MDALAAKVDGIEVQLREQRKEAREERKEMREDMRNLRHDMHQMQRVMTQGVIALFSAMVLGFATVPAGPL